LSHKIVEQLDPFVDLLRAPVVLSANESSRTTVPGGLIASPALPTRTFPNGGGDGSRPKQQHSLAYGLFVSCPTNTHTSIWPTGGLGLKEGRKES
jgi:hypothetical protein